MTVPAEEAKPKISTQREITPVFLYQAGQDAVQDIAQKSYEIFQALKVTQLPNGTYTGHRNSQDKVNKLKEFLNQMEALFKRLRVIYNECQKRMSDVDHDPKCLVPILNAKESDDQEQEKPMKTAKEHMLENRKRDLEVQLQIKNERLEVLMSQMRTLVLDMNSVLSCMDT